MPDSLTAHPRPRLQQHAIQLRMACLGHKLNVVVALAYTRIRAAPAAERLRLHLLQRNTEMGRK